jgi:hypothetical protein
LWLIDRAAHFERRAFGAVPGQFFAAPRKPGKQGKYEAEKLVYGLTIARMAAAPHGSARIPVAGRASPVILVGAGAYALAAGWLDLYAWFALQLKPESEADANFKLNVDPVINASAFH